MAGIHLLGSSNFTFEATIDSRSEGEGNVGSLDGRQPVEVIVESSSLVTFQDMKVTSDNGEIQNDTSHDTSNENNMVTQVRSLYRCVLCSAQLLFLTSTTLSRATVEWEVSVPIRPVIEGNSPAHLRCVCRGNCRMR